MSSPPDMHRAAVLEYEGRGGRGWGCGLFAQIENNLIPFFWYKPLFIYYIRIATSDAKSMIIIYDMAIKDIVIA